MKGGCGCDWCVWMRVVSELVFRAARDDVSKYDEVVVIGHCEVLSGY